MSDQTPDQRLTAVFKRVQATVLNAEGFGGPVRHQADVDGWDLNLWSTDFGEVFITVRSHQWLQGRRIMGFELADTWTPFVHGTVPDDLAQVVDLAERAEWTDRIDRAAA